MTLPVGAIAQEPEALTEDNYHDCCVLTTLPKDVIIVNGSGQLPMVGADKAQDRTLITDIRPGLGNRVENILRDEAGLVQFRQRRN